SVVIAHEDPLRIKWLIHPCIVLKRAAAVRRSRQCDDLLAILGVASTVVKDHVRRAVNGIDGHPLKELVRAVVRRIIVDANGGTPCFTLIGRRSEEHTSELQSRENLV